MKPAFKFKVIWRELKGEKLTEELKFHPTRKWRFDFAIPSKKIAFEIDGGIWRKGGGAHSRPKNIMRDIEKSNAAQLLGWKVFRIPGHEVTFEKVEELLNFVRKS